MYPWCRRTLTLTAKIIPEGEKDNGLTWTSSNTTVAAVSNGIVTPKQAGTAVITVKTSNGKTASCSVTVKPAPTKINLTKGSVTLGVGETFTLGSSVNDGAGCATRTYRTSNSSIVKMTRTDWQGDMVAVAPGTAYVTVKTYNGKESTCKVTVKAAPTKVSLDKGVITLGVGETCVLSAIIPSNAGAARRTFRTSDASVVKMTKTDWTGNFTAIKVGTAYVTVRLYNGKEASCKVTVKAAPSKVTISKGVLSLGVGETYKLTSSIPANTGAATRTFRTSNSSVVKMTKTNWEGELVAMKPGVAYVTVRLYNGKESTCKVTVKPAPSSVKLNKTSMTMTVGQKGTLSAIIPDGTAASKRTFLSSNSSVVSMTKTNWQGEFVAKKAGTAYVTVTLYNGKQANCKITVKPTAAQNNFTKVANYIKSHGKIDSDGNYKLGDTYSGELDNGTAEIAYSMTYDSYEGTIKLYEVSLLSDAIYYNGVKIYDASWYSLEEITITLYYDHPQVAYADVYISMLTDNDIYSAKYIGTFDPSTYYKGKDLHLTSGATYSNDFSSKDACDFIAYTLNQMNLLLSDSGYTVKTLGFTSFSD